MCFLPRRYERLLCDIERFLVDAQQQILVSCRPLAQGKRKRAQHLMEKTAFERVKPALAVILQRYPEFLNTATQVSSHFSSLFRISGPFSTFLKRKTLTSITWALLFA